MGSAGVSFGNQRLKFLSSYLSTFSSAVEFTCWVGTCPGKQESAEENSSSRSAKCNKYMRRVLRPLMLLPGAAAPTFRQCSGVCCRAWVINPPSGLSHIAYAAWVWKILHEGIRYIEQGIESEPKLLIYRAQSLAKQLRKFGLQRSDHTCQQGVSITLASATLKV
jgi:hypothetical protein